MGQHKIFRGKQRKTNKQISSCQKAKWDSLPDLYTGMCMYNP